MKLQINNSHTVEVSSRNDRNQPGLDVHAGEKYRFSTHPDDKWVDLAISAGADGFNIEEYLPFVDIKPIVSSAKYFKLCGKIDIPSKEAAYLFAIGTSGDVFEIEHTGKLSFFANDAIDFYWNNAGKIDVTVTRIS